MGSGSAFPTALLQIFPGQNFARSDQVYEFLVRHCGSPEKIVNDMKRLSHNEKIVNQVEKKALPAGRALSVG
jgi:hypothetical protein